MAIEDEFTKNAAAFVAHGLPAPRHAAYPYGSVDARVKSLAAKHVSSARGVRNGYHFWPLTDSDWFDVRAVEFFGTPSVNDFKKIIDETVAYNTLLVMYTHDIINANWTVNTTRTSLVYDRFVPTVEYAVQLKNAGKLRVMTYAEAFDYWTHNAWPQATVVFSFDNGESSLFSIAYPLFKR